MREVKYGERGSSALEGTLVLGGLILILVLFVIPQKGTYGPAMVGHTTIGTNTSRSTGGNSTNTTVGATSAYSSVISLNTGNASYSIEPRDEYVTVENQSDSPINLTGWKLRNNKSGRVYYVGDRKVEYASDEVLIPEGVGYLAPGGLNILQKIILKPNEMAVITTGNNAVESPYKIISFKENKCSGYIEALPQYDFTPSLSNMCVPPSQEPGIENMDSACKSFITNINSCQTPTFGKVDRYSSDDCSNCVNGRSTPNSACFNFIKEHFSYPGCLAYHKDDANFYGRTWHIFLGRKWELWGKDTEVISLFDQFGKLVTSKAY